MARFVIELLVLIFAIITLANGETVQFENCPEHTGKCLIHAVRITPCAEAAEGKPCRIKRGKSVAIDFDFMTQFDSDTLEGRAYWANGNTDLPFVGLDSNACSFTSCPIVSNRNQTYSYSLAISRKYPVRTFDVKWKLTNAEETNICCFITKIKLTK